MTKHDSHNDVEPAVRECFLPQVSFQMFGGKPAGQPLTISYNRIRPPSGALEHLHNDTLPYLALPDLEATATIGTGRLALVAVEGRDHRMADAIAALLDPAVVGIGLMHVTWLPPTVTSPLEERGIDNPEPADLLAYQGAREALVDTSAALRRTGYEVSTHLREDRDPAGPLARAIRQQRPDLFVLGLGRHGAGIGRRVLDEVLVSVLYVRAR